MAQAKFGEEIAHPNHICDALSLCGPEKFFTGSSN